MANRNKSIFLFESVKELRDNYFVKYEPTGGDTHFASLELIFHGETTPAIAKKKMETEAEIWTKRYAMPVMVFCYDEKGDPVEINETPQSNHLIAWRNPNGQAEMHWKLLKDEEIPDDALSPDYLLKVYHDIPYRTMEKVRNEANRNWKKRAKELRIGFSIIFLWAIVVPAIIAILGWANPIVGLITTLYALWKAARQGGLMLGWLKPSKHENMMREKERRMKHYYYHCERNPSGFQRIVAENFEQDEQARIKREADDLRNKST